MKWHYNLDSHTLQKIATRCFKGFSDMMGGKGKEAHFKKYGTVNSQEAKTNASSMRFCGRSLFYIGLELPVLIKAKDAYAHECLTHKIKFCRIIRQTVNGRARFYVQLVLEGLPPVKRDKAIGTSS